MRGIAGDFSHWTSPLVFDAEGMAGAASPGQMSFICVTLSSPGGLESLPMAVAEESVFVSVTICFNGSAFVFVSVTICFEGSASVPALKEDSVAAVVWVSVGAGCGLPWALLSRL